MYSNLSTTQQAVLDSKTCPHCHTKDSVSERWTRNGPTVQCSACKKRVYRPRGRAVSGGGGGVSHTPDAKVDMIEGHDPQAQSVPSSSSNSGPATAGQAIKAAEQNIGKPLSQQAKDAMSKIEQALRNELGKEVQRLQQEARDEATQRQEELKQQVEDEVATLRPTEVIVKSRDASGSEQSVTVPNAHKLLPELLRRFACGIRNFLLVGPSGSGKSTVAKQLSTALNVPYGFLPWSGDTTPGTVLGRPSPDGSSFKLSVWLETYYQTFSVFNHDELDGADPNVPICMNSAVENGEVYLPTGVVRRHVDHVVIATANTWGIGADMLYCGRNQLDAAVRDRFVGGMFYVDYDSDLERSLVPEKEYLQAFWDVRAKIGEHRLRRVWGTRALIRGASLFRGGYSLGEVLRALTVGFTADELGKLGI